MGRLERTEPTFDLVQKAREGDAEAFGCLLERHRQRLESLVHIRLGPRLRARLEIDDIVQETSLGAFRSIGSFTWQGEESFFRWLSRIAENTIRNQIRRLDALKRAGEEAALDGSTPEKTATTRQDIPDPNQVSPLRNLLRQERFERLEKALSSLSPAHREVIILARLECLPVREIAQRMSRTETAVPMLLLRALRELKVAFGTTGSLGLPALPLAPPPRGPTPMASPSPGVETEPDRWPEAGEGPKPVGWLSSRSWFPTTRGMPAFNP